MIKSKDNLVEFIREAILDGVSREQHIVAENHKPLFLQAAEEEAALLNTTADAVLDSYLQAVWNSDYPSAECLMPDEVEQHQREGILPEDSQTHLNVCKFCRALLKTEPRPEFVEEFENALSASGRSYAAHET